LRVFFLKCPISFRRSEGIDVISVSASRCFTGPSTSEDRIDVASIRAFETAWLAHIKGSHAAIITYFSLYATSPTNGFETPVLEELAFV
jgi:hypothetical protein